MIILLHPTHRKIVRLLRERVNSGPPVIFIENDKKEFIDLMQRTQIALNRHKGIYRIILRAMNRSTVDCEDKIIYGGADFVDLVERTLCKVEWANPFITVRNIILLPILVKIIKILSKNGA